MQTMKSLFMTLCVIGLAFANQSPVFLWGVNSVSKPALSTISQSTFVDLVTPALADKCLVVFLEKDLTNKDFLCSNAQEKSCFARLQGVGSKTFYQSVESPVDALSSVAADTKYYTVDASGKLDAPLELANGNVLFIKFEDASAERGSILESHDAIIDTITSQYKDNVFFMYTSSRSTALKRQRRAVSDTAALSQGYVFRNTNNLLVYFTSLSVSNGQTVTPLTVANMNVVVTNSTAMSVTLTTNGSPLTFDITLSGGYFFMTNVVYNNVQFRSTDVYSPTDFSYFCGNLTLGGVGTTSEQSTWTLKINSFQFQAPFGSTKDTNFVFGDPWHCVGFFTGGILSGLLIVALLLTITFIGVCWMMDINTMDRFDDPKGKTITISATE